MIDCVEEKAIYTVFEIFEAKNNCNNFIKLCNAVIKKENHEISRGK